LVATGAGVTLASTGGSALSGYTGCGYGYGGYGYGTCPITSTTASPAPIVVQTTTSTTTTTPTAPATTAGTVPPTTAAPVTPVVKGITEAAKVSKAVIDVRVDCVSSVCTGDIRLWYHNVRLWYPDDKAGTNGDPYSLTAGGNKLFPVILDVPAMRFLERAPHHTIVAELVFTGDGDKVLSKHSIKLTL
jgi:hypothetical protein